MARGRSVEIYLKPGIEEDDLIHEVWREASLTGRPQDLFRRILLTGIRSLYESGDLPRTPSGAVERSGLLVARIPPRRPRGRPRKHPLPPPRVQEAPLPQAHAHPPAARPPVSAPLATAPAPQPPVSGDDPISRTPDRWQGQPLIEVTASRDVPQPVPVEDVRPESPVQPAAPTMPRPAGGDASPTTRPRLGRLM